MPSQLPFHTSNFSSKCFPKCGPLLNEVHECHSRRIKNCQLSSATAGAFSDVGPEISIGAAVRAFSSANCCSTSKLAESRNLLHSSWCFLSCAAALMAVTCIFLTATWNEVDRRLITRSNSAAIQQPVDNSADTTLTLPTTGFQKKVRRLGGHLELLQA